MRSCPPPFVAATAAWLVVAAFTAAAHGSEGPELSWLAPDECPGPEALRVGVEQSLARPWGELESELSIEARIDRGDGLWRLELLVRRGGEALPPRRVEGESCAALVEAAAAIIALIIERELVPVQVKEPAAEVQSATSAQSDPAPPASPDPNPNPNPTDVPPPIVLSPLRPQGFAEMAGLLDTGSLPRAALGGRLGGGLGGRAWMVALDGLGLFPVEWDLGLGEGRYGRFWLAGAQLRGCHVLGSGAVQLTSCGTFGGAWLQGSTHGVSEPDAGGAFLWVFGSELGLLLGGAGPHRLGLGVGAGVFLARPRFFVENEATGGTVGRAYSPPPATLRLLLGYRLDP